jgi:hypothetical protein
MAWRAQPHEAFLGLVLRGAVGSVLAGSVYSTAVTGRAQVAPRSAAAASKPDEAPIALWPCNEERPLDVHLLRPRVKLDYLSSRSDGRIWNAVGLPCRGATDRMSCDAAILKADGARAPQGSYLLGTRGDSVLTWAGPEEFLALVGRIEDVPTATEYLRSKQIKHLMCPIQQAAGGFLFETRERNEVKAYNESYDIESGIRRRVHLSPDGTLTVRWTGAYHEIVNNGIIEGRRPPGLMSCGPRGGGLGAHFARSARNEAASVHAFTILAAELRSHRAPAELARRCEAAADDEVRHAEQTSRLARRFGHEPLCVSLTSVPLRCLSELAFDNAVEGCVHETYAALIAVYQARCAEDPAVAAELSTIAKDETLHATLSWDIDVWLRSRLTSALQAAVARAQREAVDGLVHTRHLVEDERGRRLAGLPSHAHCRQMIDAVTPHLWSA